MAHEELKELNQKIEEAQSKIDGFKLKQQVTTLHRHEQEELATLTQLLSKITPIRDDLQRMLAKEKKQTSLKKSKSGELEEIDLNAEAATDALKQAQQAAHKRGYKIQHAETQTQQTTEESIKFNQAAKELAEQYEQSYWGCTCFCLPGKKEKSPEPNAKTSLLNKQPQN